MTVEIIESSGRFDALHADWTDLLEASAAQSPFLTWEWLNAWWTHLRESRRLALLTVRRGGRLIALVPLSVARGRLPFFSRLEFLGTGSAGSDYLDAIVRRGCEAEAVGALAEYARSQNLGLHLDHLPPNSLLSSAEPRRAKDLMRAPLSLRSHAATAKARRSPPKETASGFPKSR